MRIFEIILLLAVTVLPFVKRPVLQRISPTYLIAFLGFLLAVHFIFEGWRWQMIPVYLLTLILAWRIKVVDPDHSPRLSLLRLTGFFGMTLLLVLGWILPMALPVFSLPEPRGSYSVGTEMIHVETGQDELISSDPNDQRELMLKIWYPSNADVSSLKGETYLDYANRSGFAVKYGLPPGALEYLNGVATYAYTGIPVADESFPVLLFSHGYGSKAHGYYGILTEIASRGYIIINMNHSYESLGATFPDGHVAHFDFDYQNEITAESMPVIQPLIDAFKNDLSYQDRHVIVRETSLNYFEGRIQDRWAKDMIVILDLLEKWNGEGLLKGKMDLNKVGVFGHSVGGGSAGNLAMKDDRIKAAVNLDGIQWGPKIDSAYQIPYLYVSADWPADHEDINSHVYKYKSTDYFYETKLLKSGHPNFMDIPFMIPVQSLAGTGEIDPYLGTEIVTELVSTFFDKHLKNVTDADLEKVGDQYDLLEMTVFKGDSIAKNSKVEKTLTLN